MKSRKFCNQVTQVIDIGESVSIFCLSLRSIHEPPMPTRQGPYILVHTEEDILVQVRATSKKCVFHCSQSIQIPLLQALLSRARIWQFMAFNVYLKHQRLLVVIGFLKVAIQTCILFVLTLLITVNLEASKSASAHRRFPAAISGCLKQPWNWLRDYGCQHSIGEVLLLVVTDSSCPDCWKSEEEYQEIFILVETTVSEVHKQEPGCVAQVRPFTRDVLNRHKGAA